MKVGVWQSGVSKIVCDKMVEVEVAEEAADEEAGYRFKKKNPTQRCGELKK